MGMFFIIFIKLQVEDDIFFNWLFKVSIYSFWIFNLLFNFFPKVKEFLLLVVVYYFVFSKLHFATNFLVLSHNSFAYVSFVLRSIM